MFFGTLLVSGATPTHAQGVTSSGIRGTVSTPNRRDVDARIRVHHDGTGHSVEARLTGGRYFIQGLEPGGPYTVTARALGHRPQRIERITLVLGQMREVDFVLEPIAARLDDIIVVAHDDHTTTSGTADGGTGTTISRGIIERFPTLNRDIYDFIRLTPQVSTKIGLANPSMSAAGAGFRYNNFLINGVSERTLSGGVSNAFGGLRSLPLAAVQEYQVLISPYDVRYGDFAGALVNSVTRSGTNTFHGSAFVYGRTDDLARRDTSASLSAYERLQYGFSLGGPIIRDRLHFFVAPELQHFTYPAAGPYVGQSADAERPVPVGAADLARFEDIMRSYGLTAGSAGAVENESPLRNLFMRLDAALPWWRSRAILWRNYTANDEIAFSRMATDDFPLSSLATTNKARVQSTALHLHSAIGRSASGHNELRISRRSDGLGGRASVAQPIVRVSVPTASGGRVTISSGTAETAQGRGTRASTLTIRDDLSLPLGPRHVLAIGGEAEWFRLRRDNRVGSFGTWSFPSLDDLARGNASRYVVRVTDGNVDTRLAGSQYMVYAGDRWQITNRLSLTGGVRGDVLVFDDRAPYHPIVADSFGRRTDQMPRPRLELSPRLGFVMDLGDGARSRIRGGAGVFTGRYPLAWAHVTLWSYGVHGQINCNFNSSAALYPPAFNPDPQSPPTSCLDGRNLTGRDVDVIDPDFRLMRVARASLAHEWSPRSGVHLTNEALATRTLSEAVFVNLNLKGPQGVDPYGRVMYGTMRSTGLGDPARRTTTFSEVIDLRNTSRGSSVQLSSRLEVTRTGGSGGFASYTFSRTRDVQTPLRVNNTGTVTWASARTMSGRHEELGVGVSGNDIPHRVVIAGTYVAPWRRARTELSFYYVGESGRPFAYTSFGSLGSGDLNVDGSNLNDPIYVPNDARDTTEMKFSGVSDAAGADNSSLAQTARAAAARSAFDAFVEGSPCLRRQRGQIMARNSCREPWSNTTIASVRQGVPLNSRDIDVQLDVFNVLNLIDRDWGRRRAARTGLLEHVGQTSESSPASRPIFRFDSTLPKWLTQAGESAFQLQLALRYRF